MEPLVGQVASVRRFTPADAGRLQAYRDDPHTASMQGWDLPFTLAQAEAFVSWAAAAGPGVPGEWCQLAIELRGEPGLVGDVGVLSLVEPPGAVELGVTLAPAARGRGVATEALALVLDHLVARHAVSLAVAHLDVENRPSARLFERLGFTRVSTAPDLEGVLEHRYERVLGPR